MPALIAPSPITAMTLRCSPFRSRATAKPRPAEIEVEECAAPNGSYSLSARLVKPESPPPWRKRAHALAPAGEDLVRIGLMADIPDQLVVGRVEDIVQRHGQLDHAEAGAQMPAGHRHDIDRSPGATRRRTGAARSRGSVAQIARFAARGPAAASCVGRFIENSSTHAAVLGPPRHRRIVLRRAEGRPFHQTNQGDARPAPPSRRPARGPVRRPAPRPRWPCRAGILLRGLAHLGARLRHRADRRRSGRRARFPARNWPARAQRGGDALPRMAPASQQKMMSAAVFMRCKRRDLVQRRRACRFRPQSDVHHLPADHARYGRPLAPAATPARSARRDRHAPRASASSPKASVSSASPARIAVASSNALCTRACRGRASSSSIAGRSSCTSE